MPDGHARLADNRTMRAYAKWHELGVRRADGAAFARPGDQVKLWLPVAGGPAFLVGQNFRAVYSYNPSTSYTLALLHLGDLIRGDPPFHQQFPGGERVPTLAEVKEIQRRLNEHGFKTDGIDGRTGCDTVKAILAFQTQGRHGAGRRLCRPQGAGEVASGLVIRFDAAHPALGGRPQDPTVPNSQRDSAKKQPARDAAIAALDRPVPAGVNAAGFGSDVVADALRALDIPYIALNPGASYRGLHDSLVNYLGNERPQMLLCLHEESAVAIAHGYAKVTGKAMAAAVHSNVGLMHATMAFFNAWCDRMPMVVLGATGPVDATKRRPWIDWIHTARDQGALVRGYTKWDDQPASPVAAREAVLRAGWIANTAPRGPTYINLDAGNAGVETRRSRCRRSTPSATCRKSRARRPRKPSRRPPTFCATPSIRSCSPAACRAISTPGTRASRWPNG